MYYYTLLFAILLTVAPSHISATVNSAPFNINDAYTALELAYSSYCPASAVSAWNCFFCTQQNATATSGFSYQGSVSNSGDGLYSYYGYRASTKTFYVVFRGSANIINWINNLDVAQVSYPPAVNTHPNAQVHQGFYDDFNDLEPTLTNTIVSAVESISGVSKVVFVGHSLGGALATLAALQIGPLLPVSYGAYTFGSPRVGNSDFVAYYQSIVPSTFRVTYLDDIVPHILGEILGFSHVAQEVWWYTSSEYTVRSATNGEDSSGSNSVSIFDYSTADHTDYLNTELSQNNC